MSTVTLAAKPSDGLHHFELPVHGHDADLNRFSLIEEPGDFEGTSVRFDPGKAARNALKREAFGLLDRLDATPRLEGSDLRARAFTVLSHKTEDSPSFAAASSMKKVAFRKRQDPFAETDLKKSFVVGAVKGAERTLHERDLSYLRLERVGLEQMRRPLREVHEAVGKGLGKAVSWACGKTGTFCHDAAEVVKSGIRKTVIVVREAVPAPVRQYAVTSVQRMGEGVENGVTWYANRQEQLFGIPVKETREKWRLRFGNLGQELGFIADITGLYYGGALVQAGAARITRFVGETAPWGRIASALVGEAEMTRLFVGIPVPDELELAKLAVKIPQATKRVIPPVSLEMPLQLQRRVLNPPKTAPTASGAEEVLKTFQAPGLSTTYEKELAQLIAAPVERRGVSFSSVGGVSVVKKCDTSSSIEGESIVYEVFRGLDLKHSRIPQILAKGDNTLVLSREPGESLLRWVSPLKLDKRVEIPVVADAVYDLGRGLGELGSVQRFPLSDAERLRDTKRLFQAHDELSKMRVPLSLGRVPSRDTLKETIARYLEVEDFIGWTHPSPHLGHFLWDRSSRQLTLIGLEPFSLVVETVADFIPMERPLYSLMTTTYVDLQNTLVEVGIFGAPSRKILQSFQEGVQAGFGGTLPEAAWDYHRLSSQYTRAIRARELMAETFSHERMIARDILKDSMKNLAK